MCCKLLQTAAICYHACSMPVACLHCPPLYSLLLPRPGAVAHNHRCTFGGRARGRGGGAALVHEYVPQALHAQAMGSVAGQVCFPMLFALSHLGGKPGRGLPGAEDLPKPLVVVGEVVRQPCRRD